jgi:hypothetical protein
MWANLVIFSQKNFHLKEYDSFKKATFGFVARIKTTHHAAAIDIDSPMMTVLPVA